jgi:tetratricopeptide (TPR) repeat protein
MDKDKVCNEAACSQECDCGCSGCGSAGTNTESQFSKEMRDLYESGQTADMLTACDKALNEDPENSDAYFWRGVVAAVAGNFEQALTDYTSAIERNEKQAVYYSYRGSAYAMLDDIKNAVLDYSKAILYNPGTGLIMPTGA